jgi:peptide/nickel transport system substrate-binding protein
MIEEGKYIMVPKRVSRRSFLKGSILTAGAVVLAARPPHVTDAAAQPIATALPPMLNVGMTSAEVVAALPRSQTLYFNGQQWGSIIGWNPYSNGMNNALAIAQVDNARVPVFETPYMYNMLDGKQYPLLADGDYQWNDLRTEITFKIKAAAKWRDGTAVTADDVAYTFASHVKYQTSIGARVTDYIDSITAVDAQTVLVKAKLGVDGKAVNPLLVSGYLSSNYVIQKAWTQTLENRSTNADAFKADPGLDFMSSGPYDSYFNNDQIVILVRNDNYWGKDASMWAKLPAPKYLAHSIFADYNAANLAFKAGEVDVSQQFIPNVQNLWLVDKLPISTYLPDAPYGIGASLPTAFYNMASYGLDQVAVRKAIAMAVDYDTIIANAMTNQSPTFTQVPRSLMNPTPGEQALYDSSDPSIKALQWTGKDIDGAKNLLDAAGITVGADGWRQYNGKKLTYVATCPNGWADWQAAIEVVAAAGKAIGIDITTNYPEWSNYQGAVTNWPLPTTGFDIFMMFNDGAGPAQPWGRTNHLLNSSYAHTNNNWNGNWGGYQNPAVDALINAIPGETDPARIKADYTEITRIYLTDIPSFTLMYRPQSFHTVNNSVWTHFPHQGDGTNPAVPPLDLTDGYGIAGLYNLTPVRHLFIPAIRKP